MNCCKCGKQIPDNSAFCNHCGAAQTAPERERKVKHRGNGQGTVYKTASGNWQAELRIMGNGRSYRSTKGGFAKKKDALDYLQKMQPGIEHDDACKMTFRQLYEEWSETHYANLSDSKITAYKIAYNRCESLYESYWSSLRLIDMQRAVDAKAKTYYTRRDMKNMMSLMGKYAVQSGYTDKNFAEYITLPPLDAKAKEAFTCDEVAALWDDYRTHEFTGAILVMIYTGMRYGELSTIRCRNVHLDDGYLIGGIKTEAGRQGEIMIIDKIKPIIQKMLDAGNDKLLMMGEEKFRGSFDEALQRCKCRPLKPHSCRHTTATMLAKEGIQPAIIKEIMRHKSYSTTTIYTHIDRDTKIEALNSIANLLPIIDT